MIQEASIATPADSRARCVVLACVAVVCGMMALFVVGGRLNDGGWYLYAAKLACTGHVPYRDFLYPQPPLTLYLYGPLQALTGGSLLAGRLTAVVTSLVVFGLSVAFARRRGGVAAAAFVALCFAVNWYTLYFLTIVKTYPLAALLVVAGAWACVARHYSFAQALFVAATLTRLSAAPALLAAAALEVADRRNWRGASVRLGVATAALACIAAWVFHMSDGRLLQQLYLPLGKFVPGLTGYYVGGHEDYALGRLLLKKLASLCRTVLLYWLPLVGMVWGARRAHTFPRGQRGSRVESQGGTVSALKGQPESSPVASALGSETRGSSTVLKGWLSGAVSRAFRTTGSRWWTVVPGLKPLGYSHGVPSGPGDTDHDSGRLLCRGRLPRDVAVLLAVAVPIALGHLLARRPYEEYQTIVFPLLCIAAAELAARRLEAGDLPWRQVSHWRLALLAAPLLVAPVRGIDRLDWSGGKSALGEVREAARVVQQHAPGGDWLLTLEPYLAVESKRGELPPELLMGRYAYHPNWPDEHCQRLPVINKQGLHELLARRPRVVAIAPNHFTTADPGRQVELQAQFDRFVEAVQGTQGDSGNYELVAELQEFGYSRDTLSIYARNAE